MVDLPLEEAHELMRYTDPAGIDFISLIAPTTDDERIKKVVAHADGVVVGSAFVRPIDENREGDDPVSLAAGYAAEIKKSL